MTESKVLALARQAIGLLIGQPSGIAGLGTDGTLAVDQRPTSFASAELTGTGAPQIIPHGLGAKPAQAIPYVTDDVGAAFSLSIPVLDATDITLTVSAGTKFAVVAFS